MKKSVLITGGAGFIGSFLADELVEKGHEVTIFDNLEQQVHQGKAPEYLNNKALFVKADLRDYGSVKEHIKDKDVIVNLASRVGIAQSMYEIKDYVESNELGTSNLMHALVNEEHDVKKVIAASSMSVYGEGSYKCENCKIEINDAIRTEINLKEKKFDPICNTCRNRLVPIPTKETKEPVCDSIYALTKKNQEEMTMLIGKTYGIPAVSLRFFNTYGPRQSLSNPYTGAVAIFLSRLKNGQPPIIFEDGNQTRDFISVHDVVHACLLSIEKSSADNRVFNVGSGKQTSIRSLAEAISEKSEFNILPQIRNEVRKGDIRHCFADISLIRSRLDFEPKINIDKGLQEVIDWAKDSNSVDLVSKAYGQLKDKQLIE